jgi:hypothetical protein
MTANQNKGPRTQPEQKIGMCRYDIDQAFIYVEPSNGRRNENEKSFIDGDSPLLCKHFHVRVPHNQYNRCKLVITPEYEP